MRYIVAICLFSFCLPCWGSDQQQDMNISMLEAQVRELREEVAKLRKALSTIIEADPELQVKVNKLLKKRAAEAVKAKTEKRKLTEAAHTLAKVSKDGRFVTMQNGQMYKVAPSNRGIVMKWQTGVLLKYTKQGFWAHPVQKTLALLLPI